MLKVQIVFCIIILGVKISDAASGFDMFFDNITCSSDDPKGYMNKLSCYLSKNVKRRTFSIELQFNKEPKNFFLNMIVILPRKHNSDFVLLNLTNIDGCKVLSNKNQAGLIKLGMSTLDRFGNIPHRCPFQKDVLYFIRGFRADMSMFPAFSFETEMTTSFDLIVEHKKVIQGYISSPITMRKNKNSKLK